MQGYPDANVTFGLAKEMSQNDIQRVNRLYCLKHYVPYVIANNYSVKQLSVITSALNSFSVSTCIRFIPRVNHVDYIYIQSLSGCYSYVGRQGKAQTLSLNSRSCIRIGIVQHELLHALGFHHEQSRSDRDDHIQILKGNILTSLLYNFKKVSTLNQGTPYDYDSVMHYGRLAFSKDNVSPTMEAYPDANVTFGLAKEMSQNDIQRVNRLYCLK
uniref:high choriolytic enzyme 1-like n=1 Tax=Monopterus albus TaxID=43700 RepID=UPI0009B3D3DF|nr:high choriolytic enzyme 1-like [Monopterus albus]